MIDDAALDTLFLAARTQNKWRPGTEVTEAQMRRLYDVLKMGPTSANCSPARFVFVVSPEGKEKLRPALSSGNLDKTMAAPLTVIVAYDEAFFAGTTWKSNFLVNIGHGDPSGLFPRHPKLPFDEACRIA